MGWGKSQEKGYSTSCETVLLLLGKRKKKKVLAYLEEAFILGKHPSVILVQYRLISLTSVSVFSVTCLLITKYICCTSSFQTLMSTIAHLLCLQNQNPE